MRGNKHSLRVSYSELQELQGNRKDLAGENNPKNRSRKGKEDGYHNTVFIFFTFYISDNRPRDLDGMVSTVLDCLVKSGKIKDDKRQIVNSLFVDYELCKEKDIGCRIRIITD